MAMVQTQGTPRVIWPLNLALESFTAPIAALIAQGHSNRAIAEALIIGERTVEGYVAHIMAKLGFSARTQIAAWVVEKRLDKGDKMTR